MQIQITNELYIKRIADIILGASTLRNHPVGTISNVRKHLRMIDLGEISGVSDTRFKEILNSHTVNIQKSIQSLDSNADNDMYWGSARKALNLFFAEACYHAILRKDYKLGEIENYFEVPLDSQVAKKLCCEAEKENVQLPSWTTIKGLTLETSGLYQNYASQYARKFGFTRIQLDLIFWQPEEQHE